MNKVPVSSTFSDCNITCKGSKNIYGVCLSNCNSINEVKNINSYCLIRNLDSANTYVYSLRLVSSTTINSILCDTGKTCSFVAEQNEQSTNKAYTYGLYSDYGCKIGSIGENCIFEAKGYGNLGNSYYSSDITTNNGTFITTPAS